MLVLDSHRVKNISNYENLYFGVTSSVPSDRLMRRPRRVIDSESGRDFFVPSRLTTPGSLSEGNLSSLLYQFSYQANWELVHCVRSP